MTYTVEFTRSAAKDLRKLDPQVARKIKAIVPQLQENPRGPQSEKLNGVCGLYGYRVGLGARIIYRIQDKILLVEVVRAGTHEGIYRNLSRL